jgi:predicted MFS family arabinose efflux permease
MTGNGAAGGGRRSQSVPARSPWSVVWALSVTQIVSWGSLYYAIAVLITPIEQELGWSRDAIVGAYSLSLIFAGLGALPVGMLIDRFGGRPVMASGSAVAAGLLLLLGQTDSVSHFYLVWIGLGLTMAALLYEPAFAVITAAFGADARRGITVLTLAGGFASTVFWPLTQALVSGLGWRDAVAVLALLNFAICLPLHAWLLPGPPHRQAPDDRAGSRPSNARKSSVLRRITAARTFWLLAFAFTGNMLAFSALSVHLIPLLNEKAFSPGEAVWIAALVGPCQVAGRLAEFTIGARLRITQVAAIALAMLPIALAALSFAGLVAALAFVAVALYGASNGIMTIVRGTIPAELFEREHYGTVAGALSAPVIASRALGPIAASLIWSASGGYDAVLWTLAALGLVSCLSFRLALKNA